MEVLLTLSAIILQTARCQTLFSYSNVQAVRLNSSRVQWVKVINSIHHDGMVGLLSDGSIAEFNTNTGDIQGNIIFRADTKVLDFTIHDGLHYAIRTGRCVYFLQNLRNNNFKIRDGIGPCNDRQLMSGVLVDILSTQKPILSYSPDLRYWKLNTPSSGVNVFLGALKKEVYQIKITSRTLNPEKMKELYNNLEIRYCPLRHTLCHPSHNETLLGVTNMPIQTYSVKDVVGFFLEPKDNYSWSAENLTTMVFTWEPPRACYSVDLLWRPTVIEVDKVQVLGVDFSLGNRLPQTMKKWHTYQYIWMGSGNPYTDPMPLIQGYTTDQRDKSNYAILQTLEQEFMIVYVQFHPSFPTEKTWGVAVKSPMKPSHKIVSSINYYDGYLYLVVNPNLVSRVSITYLHYSGYGTMWKRFDYSTYINLEILDILPYENRLAVLPEVQPGITKTGYLFEGFFLASVVEQNGCRQFLVRDALEKLHAALRFSMSPDSEIGACAPGQIKDYIGIDMRNKTIYMMSDDYAVYALKLNEEVPPPIKVTFELSTQQLSWVQEFTKGPVAMASYCIHCKPQCGHAISPHASPVKLLDKGLVSNIDYEITVQGRAESGMFTRASLPITIRVVNIPQPKFLQYNDQEFRIHWYQDHDQVDIEYFQLECKPACTFGDPPKPFRLPFPRVPDESGEGWMAYVLTDFGFDTLFTAYNLTVTPVTTDGRIGLPSQPVSVIINKYVVMEKVDYFLTDLNEVEIFYKIKSGNKFTYPRSLVLECPPLIHAERPLPPPITADSVTLNIELDKRLLPDRNYGCNLKIFDIRGVIVLELPKALNFKLNSQVGAASKLVGGPIPSSDRGQGIVNISIALAICTVAIALILLVVKFVILPICPKDGYTTI